MDWVGFEQKLENRKSKRIRNSESSEDIIHFQIQRVKSTSKNNNETFHAKSELESLINNGARISRYDGKNKSVKKTGCKWKQEKEIGKTKISSCAMMIIKKRRKKSHLV